ncbi:MAG: putative lipoprotein [Deltaproteobacteria bacterium]|nr:putative lipoprotein [Deltaproteobacteria bacterium]
MRILLIITIAAASLAACGRQAVRASEKAFLADQVMVFDDDPHDTSSSEHINSNREGAIGGKGAGGGGCGCN